MPAKKATKPLPTVSEPFHIDEADAAKSLGTSVLGLRLCIASGRLPIDAYPPLMGERYLECVDRLADVAAYFGVAERTVATWKSKGMPTYGRKYPLAAIRAWRLEQPEPPEWLVVGSRQLATTAATGDLVRAVLRVLRADLPTAGSLLVKDFVGGLALVDRSDNEALSNLLSVLLYKHFDSFCLTDEQIEHMDPGLTNASSRRLPADGGDRIIFLELPRCPRCGETKLRTTRSIDNHDGTRTHWKRCQKLNCGHAFQIVWE